MAAASTAIFGPKTLVHQKPAAATREGKVFRYLADDGLPGRDRGSVDEPYTGDGVDAQGGQPQVDQRVAKLPDDVGVFPLGL